MNKIAKKSLNIAILTVFIGSFAFVAIGPAVASSITVKNIIKLVNEARSKEKLKSLEENDDLSAAAAMKAEDMLKNDYFSHNSPSGKTPWYFLEKAGYDYRYAGENLAMNFSSAEEEQKAWMRSPTHKKNILSENYQEIGVAVREGKIDGKETTIAVQMFGSRPNFVPVSQKETVGDRAEVLGEESKMPAEEKTPEIFQEDLVNDLNQEKAVENPVAAPAPEGFFKNFQRPAWLDKAALYTLWVILVGNVLFAIFSVAKKLKITEAMKEKKEEISIPVKDLDEHAKNVTISIKVHILHPAK